MRVGFILALVLIVALVAVHHFLKSPVVTKGQERLSVIEFPDFWKETDLNGKTWLMMQRERYEVRKMVSNGTEEFIFGLKGVTGSYSNYFAVNASRKFDVRLASAQEWRQAKMLTQSVGERLEKFNAKFAQDSIEYNGRKFAKSGRSWGSPLAWYSSNKRWLVVFSYTGLGPSRKGILGSVEPPNRGRVYWDIYNAISGERIMAAHARYSGGSPAWFNTFWVEDRYLAMPVDYDWKTCLWANLPIE